MTILENLVYHPETGARGTYDLILPGADGDPCETLFVYLHGGGIEGGKKEDERPVFSILAEHGIACASVNYRMFPDGIGFPVFIEDCARALHVIMTEGRNHCPYQKIAVGGSSAGAYLSMMLFFDPQYLASYDISPDSIDGWFFDAGQPTSHFGILKRRGIDPNAVRVDETAPVYFVSERFDPQRPLPRLHFIWSEFDMAGRPEQNALMVGLLRTFGYPAEKITTEFMKGYGHCQYIRNAPLFAGMAERFLRSL